MTDTFPSLISFFLWKVDFNSVSCFLTIEFDPLTFESINRTATNIIENSTLEPIILMILGLIHKVN